MSESEDKLISKIKEIDDQYDLDAPWQTCIKLGSRKDAKNNQKIIDVLIEALNSESPLTRAYAADTLGNLEIKESVEKLKQLLKDPSTIARSLSIRALGKLKDESAISLIIELLSHEEYIGVREEAIEALRKICFDIGSEKCKKALEAVGWEYEKLRFGSHPASTRGKDPYKEHFWKLRRY